MITARLADYKKETAKEILINENENRDSEVANRLNEKDEQTNLTTTFSEPFSSSKSITGNNKLQASVGNLTTSTSSLSATELPNKKEIKSYNNTESLDTTKDLENKNNSQIINIDLKNTVEISLTETRSINKNNEVSKNSSINDNKFDVSEITNNLNETVQQADVITSVSPPQKTLSNKNNVKNNDDSNAINTEVKNITEKSSATNNLAVTNDQITKVSSSNNNESEIDKSNSTISIPPLSKTTLPKKNNTKNSNNTELADEKDVDNKDDSNVHNMNLKNTEEEPLTQTELTNNKEEPTNNSTIKDNKFDGSEVENRLDRTDSNIISLKPTFNTTVASYSKDLSAAKNNINSFSNSLNGDDEDLNNELIEYKTSTKKPKVQEIVMLGKIEKNAPLKTGTVDISAMTIKGNGNYVETGRASKTHAIRINFKMYKNENVSPGYKEVFIVIQNPKGKVINERGKFTLRSGKEVFYSDETMSYYDSHDIHISILSGRFIQKIIKGTYVVKVYIERYLTGQTLLILS